jgi:hypothetical protein
LLIGNLPLLNEHTYFFPSRSLGSHRCVRSVTPSLDREEDEETGEYGATERRSNVRLASPPFVVSLHTSRLNGSPSPLTRMSLILRRPFGGIVTLRLTRYTMVQPKEGVDKPFAIGRWFQRLRWSTIENTGTVHAGRAHAGIMRCAGVVIFSELQPPVCGRRRRMLHLVPDSGALGSRRSASIPKTNPSLPRHGIFSVVQRSNSTSTPRRVPCMQC